SSNAARKASSRNAPAMQPLHSSGSSRRCSGTSSSLTMSAMTARPPRRSTRKSSPKSVRLSSGRTRLRTQLETTTSIDSSAMSGRDRRCSATSASSRASSASQRSVQPLAVEAEVLDLGLAELDVRVPDPARHLGGVAARDGEHVVVHVDADDTPGGTHDLAREKAELAAARAQVEDRLARAEMPRRVAAAVVTRENLLGDGGEERRIGGGGTAETRLGHGRARRIAPTDGLFHVTVHSHARSSLGVGLPSPLRASAPGLQAGAVRPPWVLHGRSFSASPKAPC